MDDYDYGYDYNDYGDIYSTGSSDNADISTSIGLNQDFWDMIGIDPSTISYKETSPTNEEIEKTLGIKSSPLEFIKAVIGGKSSLGSAGQIAGLLGMTALANKMFGGGGGGYAGYKGGIPTYTASRTMNAIPTTVANPLAGQTGQPATIPRRPGSGGITYFSPMTYTLVPPKPAGDGATDTVSGAANNTVAATDQQTVTGSKRGGVIRFAEGGIGTLQPNPLDYTPGFKDEGLGSGFADPKVMEMQQILLGNRVDSTPEIAKLEQQIAQQERDNTNQFLAKNVSIDQITGDIDPIQTIRNIQAANPSAFNDVVSSFSDVPQQVTTESISNLKDALRRMQDIDVPQEDIIDSAYAIASIRANPELVDQFSNLAGDIRSITKPEDEELGSSYSTSLPIVTPKMGEEYVVQRASGGIASLRNGHLGSYSDGGQLLRGPGDGVSDDIPATIGNKQPARLANNEFVIPARIVSEIGNGSTEAGAKKLYDMMRRVQSRRAKTIGKDKVAVDSKAYKELDKL